MANFINNWVAHGVQNRAYGTIMHWWRSNFNMPVPNIFATSDPTDFVDGYGPVTYESPGTSFSFAGFIPGLETLIHSAVWHWDGPISGTSYLTARMKNPSGEIIFVGLNNHPVYLDTPVGYWSGYINMFNLGVCGWEYSVDGDYTFEAFSTGAGDCSTTTTVTISDVPDTTPLSGKDGYIWVDEHYLAFVNANNWVHRILGTDLGNVGGDPGMMWVDTSNDIHFIDHDGHDRKIPWKIKQFASFFSGGSPGEVYAGTSNAGKIWVDNEYGWTHLSYIGYDGYKYICGAGDYPYSF